MERAKRNMQIISMREKGTRYTVIGPLVGMSPQGARTIFQQYKKDREDAALNRLSGLGLETHAVYAVAMATDITHPTLTDLNDFISKNEDWRLHIRRTRGSGRVTVANVEKFAREHGLIS